MSGKTGQNSWSPDVPDAEFAARYPRARQCTSPSRQTQERCQNAAIPGGNVCRFHGGSSPQVRKRAQLRLLALTDAAIAVLSREMVTAEKSADRQRAANSILDRAGIARQVASPDAEVARQALIERLLSMRENSMVASQLPATAEPHFTDAPSTSIEIGTGHSGGGADNVVDADVVDADDETPWTVRDTPDRPDRPAI